MTVLTIILLLFMIYIISGIGTGLFIRYDYTKGEIYYKNPKAVNLVICVTPILSTLYFSTRILVLTLIYLDTKLIPYLDKLAIKLFKDGKQTL